MKFIFKFRKLSLNESLVKQPANQEESLLSTGRSLLGLVVFEHLRGIELRS